MYVGLLVYDIDKVRKFYGIRPSDVPIKRVFRPTFPESFSTYDIQCSNQSL